jgi:cell division protein FtsW
VPKTTVQLKKQNKNFSKPLFVTTLVILVVGLIAVADVSAPQAINTFGDRFYFLKQQLVSAGIGIMVMLILSKIPYRFWEKMALPFFILSVLLLILVLFPSIGSKTYGARRWIFLGPLNFQPSELVKLSLSVYLAKVAAKGKNIWSYIVPVVIVVGLIMLQPDLGTTIIVSAIGAVQIFIAGVNLIYFMALIASGGVVGTLLILFSDYRRDRLMSFIQQSQDPLGNSYHIRQVLLALGLGGLLGVGLGESRQKFLFLPEAATDSIFAIIGEEVGFVGSLIVISLLFYLIYLAFRVSMRANEVFPKVLAAGISTWLAAQILLNLASMTALVPLTGVPLPFFSYGGTALIMVMTGIGILLNISRHSDVVKSGKTKK